MLTSSHAEVPTSKEAQKTSGIPWSLAVDLLSVPPADQLRPAASFQRCQSCYGYVNKFCQFERKLWRCSLCREENSIAGYGDPEKRLEQPELNREFVDFELPPAIPAVLMLVDITGQKPYLDTLKQGLLAAIEALSDGFVVGLATVGTKVGVFQLNSPVPLVKSIPLTHGGELSLSFDEAFDFNQIFVPKAEAQKYFAQVVDSFAELADATHAHCFGTAISAVVDYLTLRSAQPPIVMARILSFLSSAPSYGLGAVAPSTMSDVQATSEFYTSIATKAVKVGARIDLIGLGQAIGLSQLRPLAQVTGGNILLYLDLQTATLPQDLYRQLSGHQGLGGILRLRTTADVEQDGYFGNVFPSPSATNLVHIGGCDRFSSLVFGLRIVAPIGESKPTLQMAFAFLHVPPVGRPRRVLRVHTLQLSGAKNWQNLYMGLDPEVVGTSVLQKTLSTVPLGGVRTQGIAVAAEALKEWVGALLVAARRHASWSPDAIDQATGTYVLPSMEQILRFCFAFSRSSVLNAVEGQTSDDSWVYTAHLLSGTSRHLVRRSICPLILPYSETLSPAGSCLPLSKLSLTVSPVLLLDALHTVVVLYTEAGAFLPCPPPKDSPLREALAAMNEDRPMAASVLIGRAGGQEEAVFTQYLIEDSPVLPYTVWLANIAANRTQPT